MAEPKSTSTPEKQARIAQVKAAVASTPSCSKETVALLEELLHDERSNTVHKENSRSKAPPPKRNRATNPRGGASRDADKQAITGLTPREKYILATEVANATLKNLAEALKYTAKKKHVPGDDGANPTARRGAHGRSSSVAPTPLTQRRVPQSSRSPHKPTPRRSLSCNPPATSSPDAHLIAVAECARVSFAYLGTLEAAKVLGKETQELQVEHGMLALIGKLIALDLDGLAIKEMRSLKKRLEKYVVRQGNQVQDGRAARMKKGSKQYAQTEKEDIAALLQFEAIETQSPALPLVASFQIYALRVLVRCNRTFTIEAVWDAVKLSNPSSPANLLKSATLATQGIAKVSRQLESLAQLLLALCPSVSSSSDNGPWQPPPETVIRLQHLALKVRQTWWSLTNHKGAENAEILEPFAKCLSAFTRRSQLSPGEIYQLASTLLKDLNSDPSRIYGEGLLSKKLSWLAQMAGKTDDAIRWVQGSTSPPSRRVNESREAVQLAHIANIALEALLEGKQPDDLDTHVTAALDALRRSLEGPGIDLDALYMEVNKMRRSATKLLIASLSAAQAARGVSSLDALLIGIVESMVHFAARIIGTGQTNHGQIDAHEPSRQRGLLFWNNMKGTIDSVIACFKHVRLCETEWARLDALIGACVQILQRLSDATDSDFDGAPYDQKVISNLVVKLSSLFWTLYVQLRKLECDKEVFVAAMRRSIALLQRSSPEVQEVGQLATKLEQLAATLEFVGDVEDSQKAHEDCIRVSLRSENSQRLLTLTARESLGNIFNEDGALGTVARVLKGYHRSFVRFGCQDRTLLAYYDDAALQPEVRGAILEYQLHLFTRTLSRKRQSDGIIVTSVASLMEQVLQVYDPITFPLRNLRSRLAILPLLSSHGNLLPSKRLSLMISDVALVSPTGTGDDTLTRFELHLQALYNLRRAMQKPISSTSAIRQCLSDWERLVNASTSWDTLTDSIDDIDAWIGDLRACVDFLNAKGDEYLCVSALHLLVQLAELRKDPQPTDLVENLCALALQLLRLGYTGKSGLLLARAEKQVADSMISIEARLTWYIAFAEYLFRAGDSAKSFTIMSAAASLAHSDPEFMKLSEPSSNPVDKFRFNRILADAAYVQSLLTSLVGNYKDSARHAKQCVMLNRRIWAALESRSQYAHDNGLPNKDTGTPMSTEAGLSKSLTAMRNEHGVPLVISVTHDALNGPDFWALIPALYRSLMQHSQVFCQQGLLHEALYVAEQAGKIAAASESPTLMLDNASWQADCLAQSGRTEKAVSVITSVKQFTDRKCISVAAYHAAMARIHHYDEQYDKEADAYGLINELLDHLTSLTFINSLASFKTDVDAVTEQLTKMTIDQSEVRLALPRATTRSRTTASKVRSCAASRSRPGPRPIGKTSVTKQRQPGGEGNKAMILTETLAVESQCLTILAFQNEVLYRSVVANLLDDKLSVAMTKLQSTDRLQPGSNKDPSHDWVNFKVKFAQTFKEISQDIAVNTLPESTIAFPALGCHSVTADSGIKRRIKSSSTAKSNRGKSKDRSDFREILACARQHLVEAHSAYAQKGPISMFRLVSSALNNVTILLSAVYEEKSCGYLSPTYAVYLNEIPSVSALRLTHDSIAVEKEQLSRGECLKWPTTDNSPRPILSPAEFNQDYIDIIPKTWTVVTLAMNDMRDELYITRIRSGSLPFMLRLPMGRHASRDLDEENFTFKDGKSDLEDIIELSDFSTRTAKDMTSKNARKQWWAEREALNTRLQELLHNMESIWLGGFKGIFSQHERNPKPFERFIKAFYGILDRHLPSRQERARQTISVLEEQVLELFLGLGDREKETLDVDEALMDLIYFIIDILNFNGEHNAYDEIDFDAIVVETHEALREYHTATDMEPTPCRHLILILDNNLHGFPWESLPCLERTPICRLPSLAALRERILTMRHSSNSGQVPGHYISARSGGTSILNPSGDLSHTLKSMTPCLNALSGPWTHIISRTPTEKEFEDSLKEKNLVLYFGHGSGAQYIRTKTVRRLYSEIQDDRNGKKECATTLLFGCSSVHLTENGTFEPSGMLSSYLTAGAPAVVGMLWDVTDKDCDRFAVRTGELWGLWPTPEGDTANTDLKTNTRGQKSAGKYAAREAGTNRNQQFNDISNKNGEHTPSQEENSLGLDECVMEARDACVLKYLNGAAAVVYGIPVYLD